MTVSADTDPRPTEQKARKPGIRRAGLDPAIEGRAGKGESWSQTRVTFPQVMGTPHSDPRE
jgi:hypothetical protein